MEIGLVRRIAFTIIACLGIMACATPGDTSLDETTQAVVGPSVTTDAPSYIVGSTVNVSYMNMPGNRLDWVAVSRAGSPATSYVKYFYTNGQVNGTQAFTGLAAGNYEARVYQNNTYTMLASSPFTIGVKPTLTTDQSTYAPSSPVTVTFTNMPGDPGESIAISLAGSPDSQTVVSFPTGGATSGSHQFTGLANGSYEARGYSNGIVVARHAFAISGASVSPDSPSYSLGQTVTVTYSGLPGNSTDWISVAVVGSPDTSYVQWHYTGGATSGTMQFTNLPAGSYEARAYPKNTYSLLARSSSFVVAGSLCTVPSSPAVFSSMATGDIVLDASTAQTTASLTVPFANSILFTSVGEAEPSPAYGAVRCWLHDVDATLNLPAGVTCRRVNAGTDSGTDGTVRVHYSVATFSSGVTVQSGIANTGMASSVTVALSPAVDPAKSFVLLNGVLSGGTGWGSNDFARAQLLDGSTLEVRNAAAGETISWQVVTMDGASVQRGTTSLASADLVRSVTINAAPSGSLVLASYTTDNASGVNAAAMMLQTRLSSSTTIDLRRSQGGSNLDVSWEAISLPFATRSGTTNFGVSQSSSTTSVAGITPTAAVAVSGTQALLGQGTGSTTYAGSLTDLVGEASATLSVGSGAVTALRSSSTATATIPWTVIDFSRNCAQ